MVTDCIGGPFKVSVDPFTIDASMSSFAGRDIDVGTSCKVIVEIGGPGCS